MTIFGFLTRTVHKTDLKCQEELHLAELNAIYVVRNHYDVIAAP